MYVRQNLLVSVVEYQTLELVSESVWLIIMMLSCVNHMACIYRLSTETESGPPPLADAPNHLIFLPTTPKITTGEFILPEFNPVYDYCSTKPNISVPRLHPGGWAKHMASTAKISGILDLIFTHTDNQTSVYFGSKFPGSHHRQKNLRQASESPHNSFKTVWSKTP